MYANVMGCGQQQKIRKAGEYFGNVAKGVPAKFNGFQSGMWPARSSLAAYSNVGIPNTTSSSNAKLLPTGTARFADGET
jgi:hypothetical protein